VKIKVACGIILRMDNDKPVILPSWEAEAGGI
jgi:hypothetical protein